MLQSIPKTTLTRNISKMHELTGKPGPVRMLHRAVPVLDHFAADPRRTEACRILRSKHVARLLLDGRPLAELESPLTDAVAQILKKIDEIKVPDAGSPRGQHNAMAFRAGRVVIHSARENLQTSPDTLCDEVARVMKHHSRPGLIHESLFGEILGEDFDRLLSRRTEVQLARDVFQDSDKHGENIGGRATWYHSWGAADAAQSGDVREYVFVMNLLTALGNLTDDVLAQSVSGQYPEAWRGAATAWLGAVDRVMTDVMAP